MFCVVLLTNGAKMEKNNDMREEFIQHILSKV